MHIYCYIRSIHTLIGNEKVYNNKLIDTVIVWSSRLNTTAGRTI